MFPASSKVLFAVPLIAATTVIAAHSQKKPGHKSGSPLQVAITLPATTSNGVAIAPDGRKFLVLAKQKGQNVPQIAEWVNGELKPYPDAEWNSWSDGDDASKKWVHANSIRFGPDGTLWVVDFGSPEMNQPVVPHGPKLVGIDVATSQVTKTYFLDKGVKPMSAVDDVRFSGDKAYLTDAGVPALIVLHLPDGSMSRLLENDTSTTAQMALRAEGRELKNPEGRPVFFHADQLEISPDGRTLYFQPCSGPLYAIDLRYVDDKTLSPEQLRGHVRLVAKTGTSGGTAIDARGNIYDSDTDHNRILKITPQGKVSTLVQDRRMVWPDAMWISADGKLWIPAAQINRTPGFNNGKLDVQLPGQVFTYDISVGPPVNDHK